MQSSERSPSDPLRRVRRGNRLAAAAGLIVLVLLGGMALLLAGRLEREYTARLDSAAAQVSQAIGRTAAGAIQRAVDLGIPLPKLYAVDAYLQQIIADNREVTAITVVDSSGVRLFSVDRSDTVEPSPMQAIRLPIRASGELVGEVLVTPASRIVARALARLYWCMAAVVLVASLLVASLVRLFLLEAIDLPRCRLQATLGALSRGVLVEVPRAPKESPLKPLYRAVRLLAEPLHEQRQDVIRQAEEIRAIDFDNSLGPRVDRALAGLSGGTSPSQPVRRGTQEDRSALWAGWWALPVIAAAQMVSPLLTGFATDRAYVGTSPESAVAFLAAVQGVFTILALIVIDAARAVPSRMLTAIALLSLGLATGGVAWIRDYDLYLVARGVASLAFPVAVAGFLGAPGRRLRLPAIPIGILAAVAVGPVLGTLVAELTGRRSTFATAGVLILLMIGPALVALAPGRRRIGSALVSRRPRGLQSVIIVLVSAAVGWFMLTALPAFAQRADFALLGLAFAGYASALVVSMVVPPWLCLGAALIASLGVGAGLAHGLPVAYISLLTAVAVGTVAGIALVWLGTKVWSRAGAPLVALGTALGGMTAAAAHELGLALPGAALSAMAIGGAALLLVLLSERTLPASDGTR